MSRIPLEYGPPGARGVATLMSVGDALEQRSTFQRALDTGETVSLVLSLFGIFTGKQRFAAVAGTAGLALAVARRVF